MPTFSSTGHALQFGNNSPTVSIYGTDTDGYIVYDMSTSGTFYQFAPNTKYFALEIIFDTPFVVTPGIVISPVNSDTASVLTASPGIDFFVDQSTAPSALLSGNDVTTTHFRISGISSSTPQLGPQVLMWSYAVSGPQVGISPGTVTSVNTNSTLTGGPITATGTLGINLANTNTWTAKQTFNNHVAVDGYTINLSAGATANQVLQYDGYNFVAGNVSISATQAGSTTATHIPYASAPNTLSDTGWSWNNSTNVLTAGAPGYRIDGDGLSITGGTNPVAIGASTSHEVAFAPSNVTPTAGDKDMALGGAGNRRWNGLWNGGRLSGSYNLQSGTTYTIVPEDFHVSLSNAAARTITLPAANAVMPGHIYIIKDKARTASTANITINPAGADTIDGATSLILNTNNGAVGLISNGISEWEQVF